VDNMIADFLFSETQVDNAVMVLMTSDWEGGAAARVIVPASLADVMSEHGYPDLVGMLPIESALAYGVIIAGKAGRSLVLTGDRFAWQATWGCLIDVRERLPLNESTRGRLESAQPTRH
jgi:hypothetical protein